MNPPFRRHKSTPAAIAPAFAPGSAYLTYIRALSATLLTLVVTATTSWSVDPTAWVVNASGESLSRINLATGMVSNNLLTLGSDLASYPNQIVVRDSLAYVVCSGTDEIQVIDLRGPSTIDFITTGAGSNPYWLAFLNDETAFVTSFVNNSLMKVDVGLSSVTGEWPIGLSPEGVVVCLSKLYVAVTAFDTDTYLYGQGKVAVFDSQSESKLLDINVGANPQYLAADRLGRIHVVCTGDYFSRFGVVYVIDPAVDSVVDSIAVSGSPGQIGIGPDNTAYLAAGGWTDHGYVYTYNAATGEVYHGSANPLLVDLGSWMAVPFQDSTAFVGGMSDFVTPVDSSGTILERFALGDGPVHLDFNYQPGDLDGSFTVDIGDLVYLVDYMFTGGPPPVWPTWRANVNGDLAQDISDLVYIADYMFTGGPAPVVGPTWWE